MEFPLITALAAAVLILLQIALMMNTGMARGKAGVGLGDGGNEELLRKIRMHGNLAENAPIFLITFAFLEVLGTGQITMTALAGIFILGRFSHAIGLSQTAGGSPFRAVGALTTLGSGVASGGLLLWTLWPQLMA